MPLAALERQRHNRTVTETVGSANLKIFAVWPYRESLLIPGDNDDDGGGGGGGWVVI